MVETSDGWSIIWSYSKTYIICRGSLYKDTFIPILVFEPQDGPSVTNKIFIPLLLIYFCFCYDFKQGCNEIQNFAGKRLKGFDPKKCNFFAVFAFLGYFFLFVKLRKFGTFKRIQAQLFYLNFFDIIKFDY